MLSIAPCGRAARLAQHVEQDSVDVVRRFVRGPVPGTLDDAEVEGPLEGGEEAAAFVQVWGHEGIAAAPDGGDACPNGREGEVEYIGGGNASRTEAGVAEVFHLHEEGQVIDALRPRDHEPMEILAVPAERLVGRRVRLDTDERRQARERQIEATRAQKHEGAGAEPKLRRHQAGDDAAEGEAREIELRGP